MNVKQTDRQAERQINRHADKEGYRRTERHTYRQKDSHTGKNAMVGWLAVGQADRQTCKKIGIQTKMQKYRTGRQIDIRKRGKK
jgi:hypothetical protein